MTRRGFTLIELLVVIAVVAILSIVVVLVLNPLELFKQARDSTRIHDLSTLNSALSLYRLEDTSAIGIPNVLYVSLADSTSTCANLSLPTLSSGWSYHCSPSSDITKVNGTGWLPVDFTQLISGQPLLKLPVDPSNTAANTLFYTFTATSTGWELTSSLESTKYIAQNSASHGVLAVGSAKGITPTTGDATLIAQWKFEEGSGSTAANSAGSSYTGTFSGTGERWSTIAKSGNYSASFATTTPAALSTAL